MLTHAHQKVNTFLFRAYMYLSIYMHVFYWEIKLKLAKMDVKNIAEITLRVMLNYECKL